MKNKSTFFEILLVTFILFAAAWLRFANLRSLPDWFLDEGEFIRLADCLAHGNFDFLGIRGSPLLIGRLPLFLWLTAGAFKLFGTDILVLRSLTALCGVGVVGISYLTARRALNRTAAIYTAVLLAALTEVVFLNRVGFTYNWLALVMAFFVFALWNYLEKQSQGWLLAACVTAGAAAASDYMGLAAVAALALVILVQRPGSIWKLVVFGGLPVVGAVLPIFLAAPQDAWHDLLYSLGWGAAGAAGASSGQLISLVVMIRRYAEMVQQQAWMALGLVGLLLLPNPRLRNTIFLVLGVIFALVARSRVMGGQWLLPVWPLIAICLGSLLERGVRLTFETIKTEAGKLAQILGIQTSAAVRQGLGSLISVLTVFAFFFTPLIWIVVLDSRGFLANDTELFKTVFTPPYQGAYLAASEAEAAAKIIMADTTPTDLVIGPCTVTWMLTSRAVDVRNVVLYEQGGAQTNMPGFDPARFLYPQALDDAKYAVVDNSWRGWANGDGPIRSRLEAVSSWILVSQSENLKVYCNPRFCK